MSHVKTALGVIVKLLLIVIFGFPVGVQYIMDR